MDLASLYPHVPKLLAAAWLLPLASFAILVFLGPRLGKHGKGAAFVATGAIGAGFVLSLAALAAWLGHNPLAAAAHEGEHAAAAAAPLAGDWYALGEFGSLRITIGYYVDALTVAMFGMVTLIATCIHVYSFGYMHEELHEVEDPLVTLANGQKLRRRGRFHRFYQYLSLFCFSMLGLVIAGNVAMVFVFWELVGICSYFLIGFYFERKSASNAANKAFIVNRVGDFGMLVGLMALWGGLGTFAFADATDAQGVARPGIFSQVRPERADHQLMIPDGMVRMAAKDDVARAYRQSPTAAAAEASIANQIPRWRGNGTGYWLLVVAGLGIFCGCVGKSAQFPLHVWLPDAMEGPTPVSALIHAATMVAAGVYLVGRFYPVFTPEVLLVIACVGCITLFIAATIALTATDIKRVLAYSTVSQLGYMMFALGLGGWVAGLFHLFTHAFFKALLFLGSGSVIHATHTNEMPQMGGLLKKMPWTALTMLVGCLAIAGAGIPIALHLGTREVQIGLSGFYSKDAILAQAFSFAQTTPAYGWLFYVAAGGAAMTAFYMFRLWYMTFLGKPRDHHVYEHAHESPAAMVGPLVVLAFFAVAAGWSVPGTDVSLTNLLEQARPAGTAEGAFGGMLLPAVQMPAESASHAPEIHHHISWLASGMALCGFVLATLFYGVPALSAEVIRKTFYPVYWFLWNKWFFDQLYRLIFILPALGIARAIAFVDQKGIDGVAHLLARLVRAGASVDDWIDRTFVDGLVNATARGTHAAGLWLRNVQTGLLRQYVMYLGAGAVALFVLITFLRAYAQAGP